MEHSKYRWVFFLSGLLLVAALNLVVFLLYTVRGDSFWIGYGFITGALLILSAAGTSAFSNRGAKSMFFGLPPVFVVVAYAALQVALGVLEMFFFFLSLEFALLLNLLALILLLLGLLGTGAAIVGVRRLERAADAKRGYLQALRLELEALAPLADSPKLRSAIAGLAEALRFSDPMSGPKLAADEQAIAGQVQLLRQSLEAGADDALAVCGRIAEQLKQRNQKVKAFK